MDVVRCSGRPGVAGQEHSIEHSERRFAVLQ